MHTHLQAIGKQLQFTVATRDNHAEGLIWRLVKNSTLIVAARSGYDELIFTSRNAALYLPPYWAKVGQSARQRSNAQGFRPATFLALSERSDGDYGFARRRQVAVMVGHGAAARGIS